MVLRLAWIFIFVLLLQKAESCAVVPDPVVPTALPLLSSCPFTSTICNNPSLVINITKASVLNNDRCTSFNDTIAVQFTIKFAACTSGSGCNSIYDIALVLAADNGRLASGTTAQSCYGYAPTNGQGDGNSDLSDCDTDLFVNLDTSGDTCGDVGQTAGPVKMTFSAVLSCAGINNSTLDLTVPACLFWNSVSGEGSSGKCTGGFARAIAIQSKCNCPTLTFNNLIDPCLLRNCDDGLPCTTDTCSNVTGTAVCINTFNASNSCSDNSLCTINDHCVSSTSCVGTPNPPSLFDPVCDSVVCNPASGWSHNFTAVNTPCNDSKICTLTDRCDGAGFCVGSGVNDCSELNAPCIVPFCNSTANACQSRFATLGSSCGSPSSNVCDNADTCDSTGHCLSNHVVDGTVCLLASGPCGTNSTCVNGICQTNGFQPPSVICLPGINCFVPVFCSGVSATCPSYSAQITCDDGNACTVNTCVNGTSCDYSTSVVCSDSTSCSTVMCNPDSGCGATSVQCIQPENQCQQTICIDPMGCILENTTGNSCPTPNHCFTQGICNGTGACLPNTNFPVVCPTDTNCTSYLCNPLTGSCVPTFHNGANCSSDSCLQNQFCLSGSCVGGTPIDCSDGFPCTNDYCSSGICQHDIMINPEFDPCPALFPPPSPIGCIETYACLGNQDCTTVYFPDGTFCHGDPILCERQHLCEGGTCSEQGVQSNIFVCNSTVDGACDLPDLCSGIDNTCIPTYQSASFVCRDVAVDEVCGQIEYCTGISNYCPPDLNLSSFIQCRPARGICDIPEFCPGFSAFCPEDQVQNSETLCDSGSVLNVDCRPPTHCTGIIGQDDCYPGEPINCNDGLGCTANSCNSTNYECTTLPVSCADPGGQCADVTCYSSSHSIPISSTATTDYSCPSTSVICDDLNVCTDDFCDPGTGCFFVNNTDGCDDGDFCTVFDQCSGGVCMGFERFCDQPDQCVLYECNSNASACVPNSNALDGIECTGFCFGVIYHCNCGQCMPDSVPSCDDGIECTVDNFVCQTGQCEHLANNSLCGIWDEPECGEYQCDLDSGCIVFPFINAFCGDDDSNETICDPMDLCDANGRCIEISAPLGTSCNEPAACESQAVCDGLGNCSALFLLNGTLCYSPQHVCDSAVYCNGLSSSCPSTTGDVSKCPINNDPCKAYICAANFSCILGNAPDNTPCNDGLPCNTNDFCVSGICRPGPTEFCDTHDFCNRSSCNNLPFCQDTGSFTCPKHCNICIFKPSCTFKPRECSDLLFCNGLEFCADQQCHNGVPPCTADDIPCTEDFCNETSDTCMHVPNDQFCSTDPCFPSVCDVNTKQCLPTIPLDCNDFNPCTNDVCVTGIGCQYTHNNDVPCSDGNACTIGDACCDGSCKPGLPKPCSDGLSCTTEVCIPETGNCQFTFVNNSFCDDDYNCTDDVCQPRMCEDGDWCIHDSDCTGIGVGLCSMFRSGCIHTDSDLDCCENCYLTATFWTFNYSRFRHVVPREDWVCYDPGTNFMPPIEPLYILSYSNPPTVWLQLLQAYYVLLADVLDLHESDRCGCSMMSNIQLLGRSNNYEMVCTGYFNDSATAQCFAESGSLLQSVLVTANIPHNHLPSCYDNGNLFPTEFVDSTALQRAQTCLQLFQDFLTGSTGLSKCDNFESIPPVVLGDPFGFFGGGNNGQPTDTTASTPTVEVQGNGASRFFNVFCF